VIPGSDLSTTEHLVTGLDNGREYTFRVRAMYKSRGYGGVVSEEATATPKTALGTPNRRPVIDRSRVSHFRIGSDAANATIGRVVAGDADGDTLTYALVDCGGDSARHFTIDSQGYVKTTATTAGFIKPITDRDEHGFALGARVTDADGARDEICIVVYVP